ncbi:MAG: NADH:flavin oxidoreductase, partial [Proteobacteria bacterium]|nr:NADH:flavin oxidoreductase [Pseudomonadota bacterium]
KAVSVPVISAGRMQDPALAEAALAEGKADLIGLARVLLADPLWPSKAKEGRAEEIVPCEPSCSLCFSRVAKGQPIFCSQWPKEKREHFATRD